ncbi:MAG: hypothetical protein LH632_08165 [Rhodoferax sp.]|nr:hypothetical protein [Rhodoferax sp.]
MRRESLSRNWAALSPGFKRFRVPAGAFALVYLSLGFLLLRAHDLGFGVTQIVLYARFNHQRGDIVVAFAVYDLFYAIDEAQRETFIAGIEPERRVSVVGVHRRPPRRDPRQAGHWGSARHRR